MGRKERAVVRLRGRAYALPAGWRPDVPKDRRSMAQRVEAFDVTGLVPPATVAVLVDEDAAGCALGAAVVLDGERQRIVDVAHRGERLNRRATLTLKLQW